MLVFLIVYKEVRLVQNLKNNLSNFNIPNNHIPNVIVQKGSQLYQDN